MKKIKLTILLLFITLFSYSQSNLQFNNVITDFGNIIGTANSEVYSPTFTVPAGKVWKLERWLRNVLYINGVNVQELYTIPNTSPTPMVLDNAPIWLKEGDSFYFKERSTLRYYFSVLEFNKN